MSRDADLRLAAWNRNFQRILDLPDAVLTYVLHFAYSAEEALDKLENGIEPQLIVISSDINNARQRWAWRCSAKLKSSGLTCR